MKSTKSHCRPSRGLSDTVLATLSLLLEASDAELHLPCEPHGFACQIENLIARGATETALRELVVGQNVEHLIETTTSQSPKRTFVPAPNSRFWAQSSFALTASGILLATRALAGHSSHSLAPHAVRHDSAPQFDPQCRQLLWRGLLVKQFRQPSDVQQLILGAFEEESWPGHIDDPLPPVHGIDPKKRLSDAIYRLNCRQIHRVLAFKGDGTGKGVKWRERNGRATEDNAKR